MIQRTVLVLYFLVLMPQLIATSGFSAEPESLDILGKQYEQQTRPLLASFCLGCHSTEKMEGELDSNVEYDLTVRDLTGIDLRPARQFPGDGAAGEGFTNTGEALVMSPAPIQKYFDATQLPVVVLGRGGGKLETARVLDYLGKPNRKMCSLFLSLMDKTGVHLKEFGDSKERLAEI